MLEGPVDISWRLGRRREQAASDTGRPSLPESADSAVSPCHRCSPTCHRALVVRRTDRWTYRHRQDHARCQADLARSSVGHTMSRVRCTIEHGIRADDAGCDMHPSRPSRPTRPWSPRHRSSQHLPNHSGTLLVLAVTRGLSGCRPPARGRAHSPDRRCGARCPRQDSNLRTRSSRSTMAATMRCGSEPRCRPSTGVRSGRDRRQTAGKEDPACSLTSGSIRDARSHG
jgi:hypothetical protein